jgi:hypothetical protein
VGVKHEGVRGQNAALCTRRGIVGLHTGNKIITGRKCINSRDGFIFVSQLYITLVLFPCPSEGTLRKIFLLTVKLKTFRVAA